MLGTRKREKQKALADIHRELTTGEVAEARDTIATALYSCSVPDVSHRATLIRAYFQLYWCVERVDNVAQVHAKPDSPRKVDRKISRDARKPLSSRHREPWRWQWETKKSGFLTWNLDEIVGNVIQFRNAYGESLGIDDGGAWKSFVLRLHTRQYLLFLKHEDKLGSTWSEIATPPDFANRDAQNPSQVVASETDRLTLQRRYPYTGIKRLAFKHRLWLLAAVILLALVGATNVMISLDISGLVTASLALWAATVSLVGFFLHAVADSYQGQRHQDTYVRWGHSLSIFGGLCAVLLTYVTLHSIF